MILKIVNDEFFVGKIWNKLLVFIAKVWILEFRYSPKMMNISIAIQLILKFSCLLFMFIICFFNRNISILVFSYPRVQLLISNKTMIKLKILYIQHYWTQSKQLNYSVIYMLIHRSYAHTYMYTQVIFGICIHSSI